MFPILNMLTQRQKLELHCAPPRQKRLGLVLIKRPNSSNGIDSAEASLYALRDRPAAKQNPEISLLSSPANFGQLAETRLMEMSGVKS